MSESCCPFCGARLVEGTAPAGIGWAVGLAMLGAACGPGKPQDETASEGASSGDSSGGAGTTGTASGDATTQQPTTSGDGSSGCGETGCTGSSEGGGFIYGSPDGGTGVKECDPWVQDCPNGQKCSPTSLDGDNGWESLICVPVVEDPAQTGEPCTVEGRFASGQDDCDVGNVCWDLQFETKQGRCFAQCTGTPDDPHCPAGQECFIAGDGVVSLCVSQACDPLAQDCGAMQACVPDPSEATGFSCVVDESGAEGQIFDPCEQQGDCDVGLGCLHPKLAVECDSMADGCCLPFCDVSRPPACTGAGAECVPWFEEKLAPPGLEDVGVCRVPP